jgi:hypothetical protein
MGDAITKKEYELKAISLLDHLYLFAEDCDMDSKQTTKLLRAMARVCSETARCRDMSDAELALAIATETPRV